ncbi:hypothetical protein [Butyrivibrio proteoclasticus]|uniref:hypothetical protein n=1 Tax=Butyrivibrio proteoclasticus TaxID=43305 RepID=UPI00047ACDFE|nr:hypothetical protein [Butyrivibrio proteoclasticus]
MAFLVTLPIAGAIARYFDKKIEECIPIAMFIATFLTYLCGILGILTVSPIVVVVLAIACMGYAIIGALRDHSIKRYLSFGGISFAILSVYYAFVCRGRMLYEQDDLLVYGKYVSDFYKVGKIFRYDYIPGMMMWEYISERFWPVLSESILFLSVAVLCLAMMLAIFSAKDRKPRLFYVFVIVFLVMFPLSIRIREVYFVLQNDFVMGVTAAYTICMYQKAREYKDSFYEYAVFMGLVFLTLTKVTGFILALLIVLLLTGIDIITVAQKLSISRLAFIGKCLISIMAAKFSWRIFVSTKGGIEKFSLLGPKALSILLSKWYLAVGSLALIIVAVLLFKFMAENGNLKLYIGILLLGAACVFGYTYIIMPAEIRNTAAKNFLNIIISTYTADREYGFGYRFFVPYIMVVVVLMFIWGIINAVDDKNKLDRTNNQLVLLLDAGFVCFLAFLFLSNYYTRYLSQASRAKECERYILAYFVCYVIVRIYLFTRTDDINSRIYSLILAFLIFCELVIGNVTGIITQIKAQDDFYNFDGLNYLTINENDVFYYIDQEGKLSSARFNYKISPAVTLYNTFSDMKADGVWFGTEEGDRYFTLDEWKDILLRFKCTYVYVATTNDEFEEMYGSLFDDEIIDGHIYYVISDNEQVHLKSIEYN